MRDDPTGGRRPSGSPRTPDDPPEDDREYHDGSPAERYAAHTRRAHPLLDRFAATRPFRLDEFQRAACIALEEGRGVLVCAPTGAGKTVVGEFAVARALATGGKCLYTTPIKALSNQKYADLAAEHGAETVGLLTGDTSVNPHAPVVVMTTEVLRNMLYASSPDLDGLTAVVLDEIHYLADRFRGAVWEEVILHLPAEVQVVGLSATVSNAEEFGAWLGEVRGPTEVVVDEVRPVPLWQHMMVGRRLYDLFATPSGIPSGLAPGLAVPSVPTAEGVPAIAARVTVTTTPAAVRTAKPTASASAAPGGATPAPRDAAPALGNAAPALGHAVPSGDAVPSADAVARIDPVLLRAVRDAEATADRFAEPRGRGRYRHAGARWRPPARVDVIERLDGAGLLPAITFVFSRAGCDAAVAQCVRSGLRLATDAERVQIRQIVDRHTAELADLSDADLTVLGYWEWREALERGIAAHHAGLLPAFKETVEELFVAGLVKAVFATETLALGINMPARTVVLEKLVKFNGDGHADLTPGEYTQLTGRAGRRGIDIEGHAVVIWSPGMDPRTVAGLASRRTYPLRSSFRPSYNMAVNLVAQMGRDAAKTLLEQSFAQFQGDRAVVGMARQVARNERAIADLGESMRCHLGDIDEYFGLVTQLSAAEKAAAQAGSRRRRDTAVADLSRLRRGDVVAIPDGRRAGLAVVLDPGVASDGIPRPLVITQGHWAGRLSAADFRGPVPVLGRLRLGKVTEHRQPKVRRDIAAALMSSGIALPPRGRAARATTADDTDLAALRAAVRAHPVHGCADRAAHLQWARRRHRLMAENSSLSTKVEATRGSLGLALDRILGLLSERGYLAGDQITDAGRVLRRIWSESDLLIAECLRAGLWRDLAAPELAGVVSALVYESRREPLGTMRKTPGALGEALDRTATVWAELAQSERRHRVPATRAPDPGFAAAADAWTRHRSLAESLSAAEGSGSEISAGDFVRSCRQVIDVLDQIRTAAPKELAPAAGAALAGLRRGVVAAGVE
jgi:ATP-dependent RNA helicase HelY